MWEVGDKLVWTHDQDVMREIVEVRPEGYDWRYPDLPHGPSNLFKSEDSSDPSMTQGWRKLEESE